jgi:uncharacterized protein YbcI
MIELEHHRIVAATRSAFEQAMREKFIGAVEELSGRRVLKFMTDSHVGPDLAIELFVLAPSGNAPAENLG